MNYHHSDQPFTLESGEVLPGISIAYFTYGSLNDKGDNVIWICHALTANADAASWWPGIVGKGCAFDPAQYFIVCANILGSCYGTTGPYSTNPTTGLAYLDKFPRITIRDMVKAHILLCEHLKIDSIKVLAGGSMGGYQALEWVAMEPLRIKKLLLLATSAKESAWGIAIHTAQRLAIEADKTWKEANENSGYEGLKAARAIAMLTYRNYDSFIKKQEETDMNKVDNYRATSYIIYQSEKLARRFRSLSYWYLSKAMDSHNIARERAAHVKDVLNTLKLPALIIGITSDLLCPPMEQEIIADSMPEAQLKLIHSSFGHDGFLTEVPTISTFILNWMSA